MKRWAWALLAFVACKAEPPPAAPPVESATTAAPAFAPAPRLTSARFPAIAMDPEYVGEHEQNGAFGEAVKYLNAEEREALRVHVRDGLLVDGAGAPLDPDLANHPDREGPATFVMDPAGNIYASFDHLPGHFHHSSFLAGAPVAAAGDFSVAKGRLVEMSNHSGHYKPHHRTLESMITRLGEMGAALDGVKIVRIGPDGVVPDP